MIISVISPVHGQAGNTTIALLVSLTLATAHKTVCLTHLSPKSDAFHTYLGLDALTDKTCTPSQAVKLLREGAIEPHDMSDYCIQVRDNLDIFSGNTTSFSEDDMELTMRFILENMPHDFIVLDVDINPSLPLAKLANEKTDMEIVCLTQSVNVIERLELSAISPRKGLFLCNHYSSDIGSMAAFAKTAGAKLRDCLPLHHSTLLMKLANEGKLADILTLSKSLHLPDIEADLHRIPMAVMRQFKAQKGVRK